MQFDPFLQKPQQCAKRSTREDESVQQIAALRSKQGKTMRDET
jgi:hypothetical protein